MSERARDDGGGDKSQSWEYSQLPLVRCRMHTCNNAYVYSCTLQTHLEFLFIFILSNKVINLFFIFFTLVGFFFRGGQFSDEI